MGKFSNILLASDFDGTLANSFGEVSENVKEKIKYFILNGGTFTVCTGRTMQGFHRFSEDIINAPVICANGMMAYDYKTRTTVFSDGMTKDVTSLISAVLEKFPGMCIEMYGDNFNTFVLNLDERTKNHIEGQNIKYSVVNSLSEVEFPLVKLMFGVGNNSQEVQQFLSKIDMGDIRAIPSNGEFLELVSKTSDKGKGVLHLADMLNIPHNRVFVVGDGSNDVDMLKAAFIGFVPENGENLAKNAGDIIVRSNDNGAVTHAIEIIEERFC